ncbi:hypothetical protein H2198_002887 [Neophaeococcomyces mojaviensis]|uniref:Uncharacterized protein n=1 Tax=Neophaeococcomyces mojaviensis TaxID=3383035 RepID=A0ACC3ACY9_9EURO|nr:hypothetical protein H2198_002887 [Knufia sp. JES_112]
MSQPTVLNRSCGPVGYGLMGLTWRKDPPAFSDSIPVMKRALELGADNWNGGELYGTPEKNSMHLLREYFLKYPEDADKVILCIKGGLDKGKLSPNSSPENVRRSVEDSLKPLQGTKKEKIDIFECARVDPQRGNESAIRTLANLVKEGKIGGIGLSEVGVKTIRESHKLAKELGVDIASVEVEISLWCPDPFNNGILAACAELGIPVFAYSPLARGQISDKPIRKNADLLEGDIRKLLPKYQDDVLEVNNRITDAAIEIAKKKGVTTAQVAIAWVKGQTGRTRNVALDASGETRKDVKLGTIIPIPGASSVGRVEENFKNVVLTEEELKELDELVESYPAQGDRYHAHGQHLING